MSSGVLILLVGVVYSAGLLFAPSLFNNRFLCPRWGLAGPPASRRTGIGAGLTVVALGLLRINFAVNIAPEWVAWVLVASAFVFMLSGADDKPLYDAKT